MSAPTLPMLETARLIVRPFGLDDLAAIHAVLNEAFGDSPLDERREWLAWAVLNEAALARLHQPPYGDRAVVLKAGGALIGAVGLVPCLMPFDTLPYFQAATGQPGTGRFTAEVGLFWALETAHRGQGYATEAARALIDQTFTALHVKRLVATTEYTNAESIAVMRRLGMRIERNPHPTPEWFQVVGIVEAPAR